MNNVRLAEAFPPGDIIKEELEARGWSQVELAEIVGRSPKEISDLILAKRAVSLDIARELEAAFGPSAQYWMNLETGYRLWLGEAADDTIARRAKLYGFAPVKEMVKRRWIEPSESIAVLEERVMRYFEVSSLDEQPKFACAARRRTHEVSRAQLAWLFRAKKLACTVHAKPFSPRAFENGLNRLKDLLRYVPEIGKVPVVLAEAGVRFLVVEPLPATKIDGVGFWLNAGSPVIALSLRYDRIDCFWHTLFHELGHLKYRHACVLDTDLFEGAPDHSNEEDAEREADSFAASSLIDQKALDGFIKRKRPHYATSDVVEFAERAMVHPGIVVGQLQFRGEVQWSHFRRMLEKVRHIVTRSALTDGWGRAAPILS